MGFYGERLHGIYDALHEAIETGGGGYFHCLLSFSHFGILHISMVFFETDQRTEVCDGSVCQGKQRGTDGGNKQRGAEKPVRSF